MSDAHFEHPRLVEIYDALDPDRSDLDVYAALVEELGARSVLDVGCGTGIFALMLADRGHEVTGVDPARGSLQLARAKPGAERVRWLDGDATMLSRLPAMHVDLVTMTANVAQAIVEPEAWAGALRGAYDALRPDGRLVFETRDPARRAWLGWNRAATHTTTTIPGVGEVTTWQDVTEVEGPLVSFRTTFVFASDGVTLESDSTLRFRERGEVAADLAQCGFVLDEVRDAPDRPARELVFLARRPG